MLLPMNRRTVLACLLLTSSWASAAAHSPLLPRPQSIQYGPARLPLRGLSIQVLSGRTPEDQFTAQELASALAIPITAIDLSKRAIRLRRTGAVDALPRPGERTGADSREAYSVKVTAEGVE